MGRISQYQSQGLASSAVGIPQADQTGQILAKGASELVQGAAGINKLFVERQEKADQIGATAKFGDFSLAYAETKGKTQLEYRDKPKEYALAMKSKGEELATQFSQGMDAGVAEQFKKMTTNIIAADADNNVNWAIKRDQEIILGNIDKGFRSEELAAENITGPEGIKAALLRVGVFGESARNFVDEATAAAKVESTGTAVKKTAITGMMLRNAQATYADLARGKYNGILTPTEEKTALSQAKEMMVNQAILGQYNSLATSATEISELSDQVTAGTVSVADVTRRLEWANLNKDKKDVNGEPIVSPQYIRGLENVRAIALGLDPRTPTDKRITSGAFSAEFDAKWDKFLSGMGKEGRGKKKDPKDYDDVISLYADLTEARQNNVINDAQFEMKKKILDTKLTSTLSKKGSVSSSLTEALNNAGKYHWWANPSDAFSEGYTIIRDQVNKRSDLSAEEKKNFIDQAIINYTEVMKRQPEENMKNIDKRRFASDIINGNPDKKIAGLLKQLNVYKHPETGAPIKIGDSISLKSLGGKKYVVVDWDDAKGQPVIALPKHTIEGFDNH